VGQDLFLGEFLDELADAPLLVAQVEIGHALEG